nr:hypothetical protein GCM10020093_071690 [Planobispora longispora]
MLDLRPDVGPGRQRLGGRGGSGQQHPAGLQDRPLRRGQAGGLDDRPARVAQDRGGGADLDRAAVDLEDDAEVPARGSYGRQGPTTYPAAEVLSAITSGSENRKFSYRESMISMPGAAAAIASGANASATEAIRRPIR